MATLKQRHKAELKALNLECEQRLAGKKGPERNAELKAVEALKKAMIERHEREIEEEERLAAEAAEAGENGEETEQAEATSSEASTGEKKLSRARLRQLKKEAKEEEEKKKRQEEAARRGPAKRELEMNAIVNMIARLGLQVSEIIPDGNCLYGAVAHQLKTRDGRVVSVNELRAMAVEEMKHHPAMFEPFLPEGETLEQHLKKVLTPGEWGGELEIRALSLALRRQIWVHRVNSPVVKMGADEGFDARDALHLSFHEHQFALGEHYNSCIPATESKKDADGF